MLICTSLMLNADFSYKVSIFLFILLIGPNLVNAARAKPTNEQPQAQQECCSFCLFPGKQVNVHLGCGKSFQSKGFGPRLPILPRQVI